MTTLQFADTHNLVAFLTKSTESEGFEQIVDFLNTSLIKEVQLQALVDGKKIIITESIIRRDLHLEDVEGINSLPNAAIFEQLTLMGMVKNVDNVNKFLMYPRFVQMFVHQQAGDMSNHKRIYVTPSHTKKVFGNMKREGKGFSGRVTPLFPTMMVQAQQEQGEGSANPTDSQHTPTIAQPSSSQLQKKHKPRKPKKKDTQIPQSSVPSDNIAEEAINEENVPTYSNDPLLNGEDRLKLEELMALCTNLQNRVGLSARVVSYEDEGLGEEDASKQGRKFHDIDDDEDITLENVHDEDMFDTYVFNDKEVFAGQDMAEKEVSTADPVTTDGEVVTTANVEVSTASPTAATITIVELTLAETLTELKRERPKTKGVVMQEPSETTTTTIPSMDKGKGIMVEEPLKMKKKIKSSLMNKKL
ncbi:hypothetical protein Tco_1440212 [Tanacetum coccineum]